MVSDSKEYPGLSLYNRSLAIFYCKGKEFNYYTVKILLKVKLKKRGFI